MAIMNFKTDKERNNYIDSKELRQMGPNIYVGEGCQFIKADVNNNPDYPYLEILPLETECEYCGSDSPSDKCACQYESNESLFSSY